MRKMSVDSYDLLPPRRAILIGLVASGFGTWSVPRASGYDLTEDSDSGFPKLAGCASLRNAPRNRVTVDAVARARLEAIVADRNCPRKHVWRARIILLTADGVGTTGIERQTDKDKTCVWRWQERFMLEGVDGLLRDKTRRSGKPPLATTTIERVGALTGSDPPHEATHWTAAAMAKSAGISISSVQRIWRAHGLRPHPRTLVQALQRSRLYQQTA